MFGEKKGDLSVYIILPFGCYTLVIFTRCFSSFFFSVGFCVRLCVCVSVCALHNKLHTYENLYSNGQFRILLEFDKLFLVSRKYIELGGMGSCVCGGRSKIG